MILEHELIEQIEENPGGRPLAWACDFLRRHGREDPWPLLTALWTNSHLTVHTETGAVMPDWQCRALWRDRVVEDGVSVRATTRGAA